MVTYGLRQAKPLVRIQAPHPILFILLALCFCMGSGSALEVGDSAYYSSAPESLSSAAVSTDSLARVVGGDIFGIYWSSFGGNGQITEIDGVTMKGRADGVQELATATYKTFQGVETAVSSSSSSVVEQLIAIRNNLYDTVVDSGSSSEPSVSVPDPPSVPEPAPVDPSPEPTPAPEPVEPLPSDPYQPPQDDSSGSVVLPGEDSTVGGEQLPGGDENQQPGQALPGDDEQISGDLTENPPVADEDLLPPVDDSVQGGFVSNLPGWLADRVYGQQTQQPVNSPVELILDNVETFQLSPIEDSTGLKGVLLRIIGPYDNIVTQYRYQQSTNQYYTYVNEVTPDYPWIASAALFIALLLSLFGLLKRSMSWMK